MGRGSLPPLAALWLFLGSLAEGRAFWRRAHLGGGFVVRFTLLFSGERRFSGNMGSLAGRPATKAPAFHELSSEFLGAETSRDYFAELVFFVLIIGSAAWPVVSMLIAVVRMIRNY